MGCESQYFNFDFYTGRSELTGSSLFCQGLKLKCEAGSQALVTLCILYDIN